MAGSTFRFLFTVAATLVVSAALHGQPRYYDVWQIGENFGLDFRSREVLTGGGITNPATRGSSTICDPVTGNLLFYSDGATVWNRNNVPMKNGTGLFGTPWVAQPALIVPFPGDSARYYIFTMAVASLPGDTNIGLHYSTIDLRGDNGLGEIVEKNISLLTTAMEKLVGVRHQDGCGFWVITHQAGTKRFHAFLVNSIGISKEPIVSELADMSTPDRSRTGTLKASPNGRMLFASWEHSGADTGLSGDWGKGDLLRFDPATGAVEEVLAKVRAFRAASFSPDNNFLYVSVWNPLDSNELLQYDLRNGTDRMTATVLRKFWMLGFPQFGLSHSMQIGPDGRIYLLAFNNQYRQSLGVINYPNLPGRAADFQPEFDPPFPILITDGLPNCIDGFLGETDALSLIPDSGFDIEADTTLCAGESTRFIIRDGRSFRWQPSTGLSCDNCPSPVASPDTTTTYVGTMFDGNGCPRIDSIIITVTPPPVADAGNDTAVCAGGTVRLRANGGSRYVWNEDTSLSCLDCADPVASPTQSTTYYVTVFSESGCSAVDSVRVVVSTGRARIEARDSVICRGDATTLKGEGGTEFEWSPAAGIDCPTCATVTISPSRTTTYHLRTTIGGLCESLDSITIVVVDPPVPEVGGDTTICVGESVRLRARGGTRFAWLPAKGLDCDSCANPLASPTETTTYRVLVFNDAGCSAVDSVTVTVASSGSLSVHGDTALCAGGAVQLLAEGAETYEWSPSTGLSCDDCPNPIATPRESTTYTVIGRKTGIGDCPAVDSVTVIVYERPVVDAGLDTAICDGATVRLTATGGVTHRWDASPDLSCLDCPDPVATPTQPTVYYVTAFNAEGCEGRDSVRVDVRAGLAVGVSEDRSICAGDTVRLEATGGERWLWEPSDGLSCADCPNPLASPAKTTRYRVTAWDADGCEGSNEVQVTVRERPEVIRLSIGRDYKGNTQRPLTISVNVVGEIDATDVTDLEFTLEYNGGMMLIDQGSIARSLAGTALEGWSVEFVEAVPGLLRLRFTAPPGRTLRGSGDLLRFDSRVFLSDVFGTELSFTVGSSSRCVVFETEPGYAKVDSICGLNFRLIELTSAKYVAPIVYPNPAREQVRFEFGLGLDGPTRLEVFDALGKRVGLIHEGELESGRYAVDWNVNDVPSGTYWYRLTSGDWSTGGQVRVE